MLKKRLKLTLDFEVEITEITEESVRSHYRLHNNYEEVMRSPDTWEIAARQNRLLLRLSEDREALDRFLAFIITGEVCPCADSRLAEVFRLGKEEDVIRSVYDRMDSQDSEFFREVSEEGLLWDNMQLVDERFQIRWAGGSIEEVRELRSSQGE